MAAERQVSGSGGGGRGTGGSGGASSMAALEDNKENEKPKSGGLGDSLGLEILQIIKESQQQHGLRHGDFQRYRGYCSRRLRRLRKTLNFKMGNRHKFTGKKVTEELLSDNRCTFPLLFHEQKDLLHTFAFISNCTVCIAFCCLEKLQSCNKPQFPRINLECKDEVRRPSFYFS